MADIEMSGASDGLSDDQSSLLQRLDDLLERHLELVDLYCTLQAETSKHLASGFISLAQANFTSRSAVRYGQDYYDGRAQALLTVSIHDTPIAPRYILADYLPAKEGIETAGNTSPGIDALASKDHDMLFNVPAAAKKLGSERQKEINADAMLVSDTEPKSTTKPVEVDQAEDGVAAVAKQDPLKWFGILVPPALRHAQTAFRTAVLTGVGDLAGIVARMAVVEAEIGQVRSLLRKCTRS